MFMQRGFAEGAGIGGENHREERENEWKDVWRHDRASLNDKSANEQTRVFLCDTFAASQWLPSPEAIVPKCPCTLFLYYIYQTLENFESARRVSKNILKLF
jgi:hypothetical protein